MTKDIALSELPIESIRVQLLDSFEEVSDTLQVIDKNWKRLERFGKLLIAAKSKVPHGEWEDWLVDTFQGRLQLRTAQRWISEAKFPMKAEARRAKDRDSKSSKATDLSLLESEEQKGSVEVVDPDPAPKPPTNRKTSKGSEKTPEADKTRTQQVPVEIVDDEPESDPFEYMTFGDIIAVALSKLADESQKKKAARELRKAADKLDPPTKFVKPDLDEVSEYFRELQAVDPDSFFDFYESKGWLVGKVSMKDWRASARKWVRENHANGKANGNGHSAARNGRSRGLTADEVFSAESMGRSR